MLQGSNQIELDTGGGRLNNWLLIVLFCVLILVPLVAQILGFSSGVSGENRNLAPFPKIETLPQAKFLPRMMDEYVNDRFGLRTQLVHLNSLIKYELGVSSTKDVIMGKDGWLFYNGDDPMLQHIGANVFAPEELEHWVQVMEADRDWLAKRGIAFYILIAPDKNTIYPEKLPAYPRGAVTRIDQLAGRMKLSTLEFIDPRQRLFDAKAAGEMVYFAGDTHWLERGAFEAYQMLLERICRRFPSVVPLTIGDYRISSGPPDAADLAALLALRNDLHYSVERMIPRWRSHQVAPQKTTFRSDWSWRITENQTDLTDRPRILVFGNSFTDYVLGPYMLYETFRDPVWTFTYGSANGTLDFNLVKEVKPDIVLVQFAERYLNRAPLTPVGFD